MVLCCALLLLHLFQSRCKDDIIQGIQLLNLLNMARLKLVVCQPSLPQPWQLLRGLHPWEPLGQENWGVLVQVIGKIHDKALLEILYSGFGDSLKEWCMQRVVVDDRIKVVYPINCRHQHPSHGIVAGCLLCSQTAKFKPTDENQLSKGDTMTSNVIGDLSADLMSLDIPPLLTNFIFLFKSFH